MAAMTSILFLGDVVARAGRRVVRELLPGLREELGADFVVANGENAAGGIGITPKEAGELFGAGVDVITLGNHTYRHRDVWPYLDEEPRIIRPANFLRTQPGRGTAVVGTHTHVPTADARVLPRGTAYITDVGMTGARGGVIGVRREQSIAAMRTHMPIRFDAADEDPWLNAVLVRADGRRRAAGIEQVLRPLEVS